MKVKCIVDGHEYAIPVGRGHQNIRWLVMVASRTHQEKAFPHAHKMPLRATAKDGALLPPRELISNVVGEDGEAPIYIALRPGAHIPPGDTEIQDNDWAEDAFGKKSNLMECRFQWVSSGKGEGLPIGVRGEYVVSPAWTPLYPQRAYGGQFVCLLEARESDSGYIWEGRARFPPGICQYVFYLEDGTEVVCQALPESLDHTQSKPRVEFRWDVPLAPTPLPDPTDARPSSASSAGGAQFDPRFQADWQRMTLDVSAANRGRVKEVLVEFYAILADLFDSYSFMGPDLTPGRQTCGVDDVAHLCLQLRVVDGVGVEAPSKAANYFACDPPVAWATLCTEWVREQGQPVTPPYLLRRLSRVHFLELICQIAFHACGAVSETPDEALFRFITDILVPTMDDFDADQVRKDAVRERNLVAVQQARPNLRAVYFYLSQPLAGARENAVSPRAVQFVLEHAVTLLEDAEDAEEPVELDSGTELVEALRNTDTHLTRAQLATVLDALDGVVGERTEAHLEPAGRRFLFFWEFFECAMLLCTALAGGTAVHTVMGKLVNTLLDSFAHLEDRDMILPGVDGDADVAANEGASET